MRRGIHLPVLFLALLLTLSPVQAQDSTPTPAPVDGPPFSLPLADPPGPNTWLYEQAYGNTTSAFNYGDVWYEFGQGLHFGVDFETPCGTPVRAIADGVVAYVDAAGFGAEPHSLVLTHPGTGYVSLYGHLLKTPTYVRGDSVRRGEVIGISGDPDGSCGSRPHLHLEIRSQDYQLAYNPLPFFDVNWHMLASLGPSANAFQQDLDNPRRWMRLEDQPDVEFSGNTLNNYVRPWPFRLEIRAPLNPPVARHLAPLAGEVQISQAAVSLGQWNLGAWWNPTDPDGVYLIDAVPAHDTAVLRQPLDGSPRQFVELAPPSLLSPDGSIRVRYAGEGLMQITRAASGATWNVNTGGNYPAISPDNTRLMWEVVFGDIVPGTSSPGEQVWIANLDGSQPRRVYSMSGGYALWLDAGRLLVIQRVTYTEEYRLFVIDITGPGDPPVTPLATIQNLHGLKIAPGGQRIAYYVPFQADPDDSGVYVLDTQPGSTPRKLDFFGAYQWRDDASLWVLSYGIDQQAHALGEVDVLTGAVRWLTDPDVLPIRVANGEWSVSPDGSRLLYLDPADYGLYLLTVKGK